jgi:hypothetical protein
VSFYCHQLELCREQLTLVDSPSFASMSSMSYSVARMVVTTLQGFAPLGNSLGVVNEMVLFHHLDST